MRLYDWATSLGLLSSDRGDATEYLTEGSVLETLIKNPETNTDQLSHFIQEEWGIEPVLSLDQLELSPDLIREMPLEFARNKHILPVLIHEKKALLSTDPEVLVHYPELILMLDEEPDVWLTSPSILEEAINRVYFEHRASADSLVEDFSESNPQITLSGRADLLEDRKENEPATNYVNSLLMDAVRKGASDIHIEPYSDKVQVRFRIDGLLEEQPAPPRSLLNAVISRIKILGKMDIAEKRLPQDGTTKLAIGKRDIDFRISTLPVSEGERVVLRVLQNDEALIQLKQLGMPAWMLETFRKDILLPNGVIWLTGPTGSGKTTTLYAALNEIDKKEQHIVTIEDPVEYQLPGVSQINVKPRIGLTFAQGLRHILRQDPDVILVGETRDVETAEIVVRASLTGHLVFSTLHTNAAIGGASRLMNMGIPAYLLAESTRAFIGQRLLRKLCSQCKRKQGAQWIATGCEHCRKGYAGRIGVFEYIRLDEEMVTALLEGRGLKSSAPTLHDDAYEKVALGITTEEEVNRVLGPVG